MKVLFWISLLIVFYTYVGYGILLWILIKIKRLFMGKRKQPPLNSYIPSVTLVIAAYNEESIIEEKIFNSMQLNYPADSLRILFVTDGSSDATTDIVGRYSNVDLLHSPDRKGKIHAIHRAMKEVRSEIVVFTDANTFLNPEALQYITRHYVDGAVGAVSGEKRVNQGELSDATAGEGFYWKYESRLKTWDSELYSVVGAAGELFSVRRSLYTDVEPDTILDDFMISMLIAEKGYRIVYEPAAYALESPSDNITEELKRKIRIAAGGIQSISRLVPLLNPFKYPILSFQYVSHRVLRWTITPFMLIVAFLLNIVICTRTTELYGLLLIGQCIFYAAAFAGWILAARKIKIKALFIPYYFCVMNYAVFAGIIRFIKGNQSAAWDKSKRKVTLG